MKNISIINVIILIVLIVTGTQICSIFSQGNPDLISKEQQGVFLDKMFVNKAGDSLPYRVLWPKDYNPDREYPLVLFLHGAGERGNDNNKQLTHGSFLFLDSLNQVNYPCIAIFPQCPENGYWSSVELDRSTFPIKLDFDYSRSITPSLNMAIQISKEITEHASVDMDRLYIMGLSMGGMGTFEAVYRFPNLWAAAISICGAGDVSAYSKKVNKIPFWIFHGEEDVVVSVKNSRDMVNKLKELNVEVTYTEYPGVNHNSWENAFSEPNLFQWLFSKEK